MTSATGGMLLDCEQQRLRSHTVAACMVVLPGVEGAAFVRLESALVRLTPPHPTFTATGTSTKDVNYSRSRMQRNRTSMATDTGPSATAAIS